jgi:hypothetical protein
MRCAADWPVRSVFRTSSLPQTGLQVLGANLKCSESEALGGLPVNMPLTLTRIADDDGSTEGLPKRREIMSSTRTD